MSTTYTSEQIAIAALIELSSKGSQKNREIRAPKIVEILEDDEDDGEIVFLDEEPLSIVVKYDGTLELCLLWTLMANLEQYEPGIGQMIAEYLLPKGWSCHLTPERRILGDGTRIIYDKNYFYNPVSGSSQWSPVPPPIEDFKLSVRCCATCSMPLNPTDSYCRQRFRIQAMYHRMIDLRPGDEKRSTFLPIISRNPTWPKFGAPSIPKRLKNESLVSFTPLRTEGSEKSTKLYHELNKSQLIECLERNGVKRENETWRECARRFRVKISMSNPKKYELQEILLNIRIAGENIKMPKPSRPQANPPSWLERIDAYISR